METLPYVGLSRWLTFAFGLAIVGLLSVDSFYQKNLSITATAQFSFVDVSAFCSFIVIHDMNGIFHIIDNASIPIF